MDGYHPLGTWERQKGTKCCIYSRNFCFEEYVRASGIRASRPCGPACDFWVDPGNIAFLPVAECPAGWIDALHFLPKEEDSYFVIPAGSKSAVFVADYSPIGRYFNRPIPEAHGRPCFYLPCVGDNFGGFRVYTVRYWMVIPPILKGGAAHA